MLSSYVLIGHIGAISRCHHQCMDAISGLDISYMDFKTSSQYLYDVRFRTKITTDSHMACNGYYYTF